MPVIDWSSFPYNLIAVVFWIFCGYMALRLAKKRNRPVGDWVLRFILFGPLALVVILLLPKHEQVVEDTPNDSEV